MNILNRSLTQLKKTAMKAFQTFPAAIANAIAFSLVTIVRIHLDWQEQEAYNFLFNCLHWSFALGAIFSLASITAAKSRYGDRKSFVTANIMGAAAAAVTFLLLYFLAGENPEDTYLRYKTISFIASARVSAAIFVSFLTFVVLAGYQNEMPDFASSLFMTHKAFFIALIYGIVIMSGTSGVAGAVRALLYKGMSSKVYMYIGTVSGFLAFTIFTGYFPDFTKGVTDDHRAVAQKQPRFVEVLFQYIMVPIVLAMTVVLVLWAGKTILGGMKANFVGLSAIATSYAIGGIWLHIMVTHNETGPAGFYRKVYPITALLILAFEAWAFVIQLQKYGLKITEYNFIIVWIVALAAAVLLIAKKQKAHHIIVAATCAAAVLAVLPAVGFYDLPVSAQVNRLEDLLQSQGMLENDRIIPAKEEPEKEVREKITDAVSFLTSHQNKKLPAWFDKDLMNSSKFSAIMGFNQTWPEPDDYYGEMPGDYMSTNLYLEPSAVDISGYKWAVNLQDYSEKGTGEGIRLDGDRGTYEIYWKINQQNNIPSLEITLDDRTIIENDMNDYVDRITSKYPPQNLKYSRATLEDMSLELECPEISVLLVFRNFDINVNTREDYISYFLYLEAMYIREK